MVPFIREQKNNRKRVKENVYKSGTKDETNVGCMSDADYRCDVTDNSI